MDTASQESGSTQEGPPATKRPRQQLSQQETVLLQPTASAAKEKVQVAALLCIHLVVHCRSADTSLEIGVHMRKHSR